MHSLHLFIDIFDTNSNTIITITSTHSININQSNYIDINTTFINVYSHSSLNFQRLRTSVRTKRWTSERFQPIIKQIPPLSLSLSRVVFFSKTREEGRAKERRVARGVEEGLQTGLERQWNNVTWVRRIGVKWEIRVTRCHVAVHHAWSPSLWPRSCHSGNEKKKRYVPFISNWERRSLENNAIQIE